VGCGSEAGPRFFRDGVPVTVHRAAQKRRERSQPEKVQRRLIRAAADGKRRRVSPFPSRSAALAHYHETIEPSLRGEPVPVPELTLAEFVPIYVERHAANVRQRTIRSLRQRLGYATRAFGGVPLRDLERMGRELAAWRTTLPERSRYDVMRALRQALEAGVRWGYLTRNPAKAAGRNPQPPPREVRAFTAAEIEAIAAELSPMFRPLPAFAAATGLRPQEWQALERRDVDRSAGLLNIRRTVSSGEIVELGKTGRSRRQVPLSPRALDAIDALPARLDSRYLIPARRGGVFDLHNFRRRERAPAVEASGVRTPARIYDLRSMFASNALAAGIAVFELARIMGTSVAMIERAYGTLIEGAGTDIARRLGAFERSAEQSAEAFVPRPGQRR
jgi:integrase